MNRFLLLLVLPVCAAFAESGIQDVPSTLPDVMRPKSGGDTPTELRDTNFFGRVKDPRLEPYDPFRSAFFQEGRDTLAESMEGGQVLEDMSHKHVVRYGSLPTVAITYGRTVSVLLMRNGKIIMPKKADIIPPPEDMVQVVKAKSSNSPYIYFQANEGANWPENNPFTNVFVPMELEGRPIQFQIRLKVVPPTSDELTPLVILDMVGDLPEVLGDDPSAVAQNQPSLANAASAAKGAAAAKAAQAALNAGASGSDDPAYEFTGTGPRPAVSTLSRAEIRKLFPTMREMAKLYEQAVYDKAPGYTTKDIVRFRPKSVKGGQIVAKGIPAFRNENDGQLYYVPWGYYFPEYDAVMYEMVFKNKSDDPIYFDYSLMRVLFGFDRVDDRAPRGPKNVAAANPEFFEKTPSGEYNRLWIVVQGNGIIGPSSPVRFLFPPSGVGATIPVLSGESREASGVSYQEGQAFMVEDPK